MQLEFARPWALVLLPVCAGIIILISILDARRFHGKRPRGKSRRYGEIALRIAVISLTVLAIAGVSIRRTSNVTTTVFLVDVSDSARGISAEEIDFVRSAISKMPQKNQAGIVVFGGDAKVEQFVSDKKAFTDVQSKVIATATNLQQAVQTGMALFPDDSAKRLVLLTDGAENEGNLADLAVSFSGSDIEFKAVKYDSSVEKEVYVSAVDLPEKISKGDQFQVNVEVVATEPTNATVFLYSGRTLKGQKEVSLQKGSNQLVFSDQGVEDGLKSYRVVVEAEKDTVSVNNTYSAFTMVEAQSNLLVVEGEKDGSKAFTRLLDACNYSYEVVSPSGVPVKITDLMNYQSVIFVDVYADDLRKGFQDTLETYVKDYAGGFVAIGGPNSYALGNYRNTPIETVLPVKMDLEGEKKVPKIAMTMVIDHSGSMSSASTAQGGISCMELAKQAATNALDSLREIDEVGVIAFDDSYTWAVKRQEATDLDRIAEQIGGIYVQGGTSIYPAVQAAIKDMEKSDATLRHIVLLTDGQDEYNAYGPLLEEMRENGITLSTVAIGEGSDARTLEYLAQEGGGRYYYSDAGSTLPRIFAQEVFLSAKSYLINEEFTPVLVNSHDILQGIFDEGAPSLFGYIAATPKSSATVLLESHKKDPVLTVWQYGLGHTVAWTSDGTGEWTGNYAGWDKYAMLWQNIIDWTIADSQQGDDTLSVTQEASSAVIHYETKDYSKETKITAMITDEEGNQQEVSLSATAPGIYQAQVPLDDTGIYSVNLRNSKGQELVKNINTATAMQYSKEYRYAEVSGSLDSFVAQISGKYIESADQVFDTKLVGAKSRIQMTIGLILLAVFLFMLDVIARRISLDWLTIIRTGAGRAAAAVKARASAVRRAVSAGAKEAGKQVVSPEESEKEKYPKTVEGTAQTEYPKTVEGAAQAASLGGSKEAGNNSAKAEGKQKKAKKKEKKAPRASAKAKQSQDSMIDAAALLKKKQERDNY